MGKCEIISVMNAKGGVGKTTSTICLGQALTELGERVLIIDCEPQGSSSKALGVEIEKLEKNLFHVLSTEYDTVLADIIVCVENNYRTLQSLSSGRRKTVERELWVAPSNRLLRDNAAYYGLNARSDERLKIAIEDFLSNNDVFTYILIDTPPSEDMLFNNAILACDHYLIPTAVSEMEYDEIPSLLYSIEQLQKLYKRRINLLGILATRVNASEYGREFVEFRDTFKKIAPVFKAFIPFCKDVRKAFRDNEGPLSRYPNCAGSIKYREVAKEIRKNINTIRKGR